MLKEGGKEVWYKSFDVAHWNNMMNNLLNSMEILLRDPNANKEVKWSFIKSIDDSGEKILKMTENLPGNAHKKQRNFSKENRIMERIMDAICDDIKEAKEVKKEINEIIEEIARKEESPWKTEYFEDKNDPWEYKIGYCTLEKGVCVE
jgi:hypothetical protein